MTTTLTTSTLTTTTFTTTTISISTTSTSTTLSPDAIVIKGTKEAGTWLYINDSKVVDIPLEVTEWRYAIEYPIVGVNALKIYTQDENGNKSEPVVVSNVFLQDNMESVSFAKDKLLQNETFSIVNKLENLDLKVIYGTDPNTGQTIALDGYLRITK